MNSKFTPTKPGHECFCSDQSGKCRHVTGHTSGKDAFACMTYGSANKGEKIGEYVCTKSGDGTYATFVFNDSQEYTEQQRQEWLDKQRIDRVNRERERQESLQNLLPISKRDEQYRLILNQFGLSKYHHHNALHKKRGLMADEILFAYEQGWIRTWKPGFEVTGEFPKLAGINPSTNVLTGVGGISIASTDGEGHITGFQIATDNRDKYGKYIWLSSKSKGGNSPHLPNGELPLFIWRHPEATEITESWLVEGGLKSMIVALKLWFRLGRTDIQVIGAAGANFKASSQTFELALEVQTSKIVRLFPDGGSISNQVILNNYKTAISIAANVGFDVAVGWWGQYTKAKNDIDELQDFNKIDFLAPDEFFNLGGETKSNQATGNTTANDESNNSKSGLNYNTWQTQDWLKRREFTPTITINQAEFSFDNINIPDSDVIVAVKSGLGTGKTNALLSKVNEANSKEIGTFTPGYRNNLLLQTSGRASSANIPMYHLHLDDDGKLMLLDKESNILACIDSMKKVDGHLKGRDIHIDETCSVLLHAVTGGTLGDEQATILRIFSKAIDEANRVFLYDGNLSNLAVDFIAKLAPNKRVITIENKQTIPAHNITFIDGINDEGEIKKRDRSPLIKFILKTEVKPWIFCDSKERTKVLYKLLTESGKRGYVLNSETTGEDWAKEFLANPSKFIEEKKPDFMVLSPSADSGISCTVNGYFTHKLSFFSGVLRTNSQHQAMFRLRDNTIPHYVFCPEHSDLRTKSTPRTYIENKLKQIANEQISLSAKIACQSADSPEKAQEAIADAIKRQNDEWWNLSHRLSVIDNFEIDHYRACLIHALTEVGHTVTVEEWETATAVKEAEKQARLDIQQQHAKEVFSAVEFNTLEEANKKAKASPNKETQRRIEKTRLLDRLPGIEHSEVWGADFIFNCHINNREFIRQQERYWLLSNYDVSQKRHESIWNHAALSEDFFSRRVSSMGHDTIWALRELDLLKFTEGAGEYHKDSLQVKTIVETLRARADIQLALRISQVEPETAEGKERLRILNSLLNYIGYKTQFTKRRNLKTDNGTIKIRHYAVVPNVQELSSTTPPHSQQGELNRSTTPPPSYIEQPGCGTTQESSNGEDSSHFDMMAARQAILTAVENKLTRWMDSDKSKVSWIPEQVETETSTSISLEQIVYGNEDVSADTPDTEQFWTRVKSFVPAVQDMFNAGINVLMELPQSLTLDERWGIMTEWGSVDAKQFEDFNNQFGAWIDWCNAGVDEMLPIPGF